MYQRIVVGTDGSDTAAIAVRQAIMLAKAGEGTLHIVHAFQDVSLSMAAMAEGAAGSAVNLQALNSGLQENGNSVLAAAAKAAEAEGVATETHLVRSDPADALLSVAGAVNADLLVVGNRGMSGMKRFVLGSVPNRVSHHCPCNLLIVDTTH
jgi:nucleotide-binding universal stress UspA family protein